MGRVTQAQLAGVEADRDQLRDQLAQAEADLVSAHGRDSFQSAQINDLHRQIDAQAQTIDQQGQELIDIRADALGTIDQLSEAASAALDAAEEQINFLVQGLLSIVAYRGDNTKVTRSLALSAAAEFLPDEAVSALISAE